MGVLVFDLEIEQPVSEVNGGWNAARKGDNGVSCAVTYDSDTDLYRIWDRHNLSELAAQLEQADCVVGWNSREFDLPCLSGVVGRPLVFQAHYDVLQEVWKALGKRLKGFGLGPTSERTLGVGKVGSGEGAPELWATGRIAELHSYCLHDVWLTWRLFSFVMQEGYVVDPDGEKLVLRPYEEALEEVLS